MTATYTELDKPGIVVDARLSHGLSDGSTSTLTVVWDRVLAWLTSALERVDGDHGTVVSFGHDHVRAFFKDDTLAAVSTAIDFHETELESREGDAPPMDLRVGVARGEVRTALWSPDHVSSAAPVNGLLGSAPGRAAQLASVAVPGALLVDTGVVADLSLRYLGSTIGRKWGWHGADYLAPVKEMREGPTSIPLVYHELKWSGEELMEGAASSDHPVERMTGALNRWNGARGASIVAQDGEIFSTSVEYIVGREKIAPGRRVFFVPIPASEPGRTRRAAAVIGIDSVVVGIVVKVFPDRRYAFVRVEDGHGHEQDVFLHADDNQWPLEVGDLVRFRVSENVRGATAVDAELL